MITFSSKSFDHLRTAPDGSTMPTTRLTVVKKYGYSKVGNLLVKKNYINLSQINYLFEKLSNFSKFLLL